MLIASSNCSFGASSASRVRCDFAAMPDTLSNGIVPGAAGAPIWITISSAGNRAACSWPGNAVRSSGARVLTMPT